MNSLDRTADVRPDLASDDLTDEVACPVNCATATVAAAFRAGGDCRDQIVLVQGAGMLGLTASAMARRWGAREVIVCDVNPQRLLQAPRFGATQTVTITTEAEELREVVRSITAGRAVEVRDQGLRLLKRRDRQRHGRARTRAPLPWCFVIRNTP